MPCHGGTSRKRSASVGMHVAHVRWLAMSFSVPACGRSSSLLPKPGAKKFVLHFDVFQNSSAAANRSDTRPANAITRMSHHLGQAIDERLRPVAGRRNRADSDKQGLRTASDRIQPDSSLIPSVRENLITSENKRLSRLAHARMEQKGRSAYGCVCENPEHRKVHSVNIRRVNKGALRRSNTGNLAEPQHQHLVACSTARALQ
jgi:hypothetical protein